MATTHTFSRFIPLSYKPQKLTVLKFFCFSSYDCFLSEIDAILGAILSYWLRLRRNFIARIDYPDKNSSVLSQF